MTGNTSSSADADFGLDIGGGFRASKDGIEFGAADGRVRGEARLSNDGNYSAAITVDTRV